MFAIELQSRDGEGNDRAAEASGRITIGDFTETFVVPLGFWAEADYRLSWRNAFRVLNADPDATSCMMTSVTDPRASNFLVCWPMYRAGEDVRVQNAMIFLDEAGAEDFDPAAPWRSVSPRREADEDGSKVSEWVTCMDSLREFFRLAIHRAAKDGWTGRDLVSGADVLDGRRRGTGPGVCAAPAGHAVGDRVRVVDVAVDSADVRVRG